MEAKQFGQFIVGIRKEKKMTQAELAEKINVTDKAVSRWERGLGFPDIQTLEPLAQALGISVLELMRSKKKESTGDVDITETQYTRQEVDEIVATGGPGMVKAAYSSGKPSLGVGQGNVQVIVDRDVDIAEACGKIIAGRRFDNGLICLGEQTAFVPEEKFDEFIAEFRKQGGYYAEGKEATDKLREGIFPGGGPINRDVVGLSAEGVAEKIGIEVPAGTKVLGATATVVGKGDDLCREKLCPVINIMPYGTFEEGVADMVKNLEFEGKGHSVAIHSNNPEHVEYCGIHCSVSRCIVNQPAGTTGGGSPTNGYPPTTTLGCGSWGNNSFSGNFNYEHLMNITRVGYPYEESYLPDPAKAWD